MTNEEAIDIVLKMAKDQWIITASNIETTRRALEVVENSQTERYRRNKEADERWALAAKASPH